MKYSELINFTPIESVIEMKSATESQSKSLELIKSYVISDDIVKKFDFGILENIQFDEIIDNKGVFIVGNYGTGKSHLMSVISLVAEDEKYLKYFSNKMFENSLLKIAGKFEVIRIEVGAVDNSLSNIVMREIERDLEKRGINYEFPDMSKLPNNKVAFEEMMSIFEEHYQENGYLLVIDELLDFLRNKKEHDLMKDLGFLRELGEFIKTSRFRLICGIQEQLFDNPSFSFVSKSLNRVKDRFQQVIIRKEDTAFLVSERLLAKSPEQKAKIREHLLPFCSLYKEMSERIEDYVELYPIHPSFIDVFGKITSVERREILKTISSIVRNILDKEIIDGPGIISFDQYWGFIKDNMALRTEYEVKEVLDKSLVLEDKIKNAMPNNLYKPIALRVINALSVHRLATGGIDVKIGLSAENLKNDLCLFNSTAEGESELLLSIIQTALKNIINLVSGQFIEFNGDNEQYFLDLKKNIDYDAKIIQKAEMISDEELNRYYFDIIYDCLEWDGEQYIPNFKIYEYLLNWESRNVFRRGYLFMGVPEARSTAEPIRDFYINILPPYGDVLIGNSIDEDDEIMFKLRDNNDFKAKLKLYAATLEMKLLASDTNIRNIYISKAKEYKKHLQENINKYKLTAFEVIHKGEVKQIMQLTQGKVRESSNLKDVIDLTASVCFDKHFSNVYPEFPVFKNKITIKNQAEMIQRAIKTFSGQKTIDSVAFLESFNLIEGKRICIDNSKYAQKLIKKLNKLKPQSVINFTEIIQEKYDGYNPDSEFVDKEFNIDLEYFVVVLLSLVYCGKCNLVLKNGTTISVENIDKLPKLSIVDLMDFKYIAKPKKMEIEELKKLFEILGISEGLLINDNQMEKGLECLLTKAKALEEKVLLVKKNISNDFKLWGEELLPVHILNKYILKVTKLGNELGNFKVKYINIAKLKSISIKEESLEILEAGLQAIEILENYNDLKNNTSNIVSYISNIELMDIPSEMKEEIAIAKRMFNEKKSQIIGGLKGEELANELNIILLNIKNKYINLYYKEHSLARLGVNKQNEKNKILQSKTLNNLKKLAEIETIFQVSKLKDYEIELSGLKVCYELTKLELEEIHVCKHCNLRDISKNINVENKLTNLESKLNLLKDEWLNILLSSLEDPLVLENKILLKKDQQRIINNLIENKELPEIVDKQFVETFNILFSELDKVIIEVSDIEKILLSMGPSTILEVKNNINKFLDKSVRGKNLERTRIIIQDNSTFNKDILTVERQEA